MFDWKINTEEIKKEKEMEKDLYESYRSKKCFKSL